MVATTLDEKIRGEERKKREIQENITKARLTQITLTHIRAFNLYYQDNKPTQYSLNLWLILGQVGPPIKLPLS